MSSLVPVFVAPVHGPCLVVPVELDSVLGLLNLKRQIEAQQSVPVSHQRLLFAGKQLLTIEEGGRTTLRDYGVDRDCTLHLTLGLQGGLRVRVETLGNSSNFAELMVSPSDTILNVKHKIFQSLGIPPEEQELVHSGVPLEDSRLVFSYEFQPNSLIHLIVKDRRENSAPDTPIDTTASTFDAPAEPVTPILEVPETSEEHPEPTEDSNCCSKCTIL